jgi:hypothetical protein
MFQLIHGLQLYHLPQQAEEVGSEANAKFTTAEATGENELITHGEDLGG